MSAFRWAILGTGAVSRKFVLDTKAAGMDVSTVASRNPDNAKRFAKTFGGRPATYSDAVQDCDAVYIATPAAQHEEHAMMAIAAGKPVLVEKPFAPSAESARRIAQAADEAGVFCMEAMWTRLQPLPQAIHARVADGAIGAPRGFEARFMVANIPDAEASLFDPARAGGALLHRGIYPISMATYFLGPVEETSAILKRGDTGVDEDAVVVLRHDNGAISSIRASLRANGPDGASLFGTEGTLSIDGPIWRPTGATLQKTTAAKVTSGGARRLEAFRESRAGLRLSGALARLRGRKGERITAPFEGNGYRHEAEALRDAVAAGLTHSDAMPLSDSVHVLEIIEAALAQMEQAS